MPKFLSTLIKRSLGAYINLLGYISPERATKMAYKFFSEPRDGRLLKDALPEVLQQAEAEVIYDGDAHITLYRWKGNATTVLLVHGWESNASRWEQMLDYLRPTGCTVMALDAPAHGLSSGTSFNIPGYADFVDIVVRRYTPQYLVGHSLGGATSLYYQSRHPYNSIKKMVILGAPCDLDTILLNYRTMLGLNERVRLLMDTHFKTQFKINTEEFSCGLFAKELKTEGLLVHDCDDEIVAYAEAEKIAEAWPSAEFITTNGLGHSLHDAVLYKQIIAFLFDAKAVTLPDGRTETPE
ncbi:alpha/beta hydrolase [Flavobacterium sp. J372]|uniref:alpha/beta hydrolase n=1 Tax=Flavobacterium sp. J372 TaxID=2898436 RepID=UPI0021507DA1|nr:alpha/beta hydrolase [Flavobacterium sp. J372]MCR5860895.1 alpha/beta hydrolase [Flavobacterium sp. J372]